MADLLERRAELPAEQFAELVKVRRAAERRVAATAALALTMDAEAVAMRDAADAGLSTALIADAAAVSRSTVRQRVALARMPEAIA